MPGSGALSGEQRVALRSSGARLRDVPIGALFGLCAWVVAGVIGFELPLWSWIAGALLLVGARRAVAVTGAPPTEPVTAGPAGETAPRPRGPDVARWRRRLTWAVDQNDAFDRVARPALAAVADERLRQRHGITLATAPDTARRLLGEDSWTLLTDRTTTADRRRLETLAARLEAL